MAIIWYPDFCPSGRCAITLEKRADRSTNWDAPISLSLCNHHASIKATHGLNDIGIFRAIVQSSRVKEAARWAVKRELGLDKDHPGVSYRVLPNGNFAITTSSQDLSWRREDGSPGPLPLIFSADRIRAANRAAADIAAIERPAGTSTVTVE